MDCYYDLDGFSFIRKLSDFMEEINAGTSLSDKHTQLYNFLQTNEELTLFFQEAEKASWIGNKLFLKLNSEEKNFKESEFDTFKKRLEDETKRLISCRPCKFSNEQSAAIIMFFLPTYASEVINRAVNMTSLEYRIKFAVTDFMDHDTHTLTQPIFPSSPLTRVNFLSFFYREQVQEIGKLQAALLPYGTGACLSPDSRKNFQLTLPLFDISLLTLSSERETRKSEGYPIVNYDQEDTLLYLENSAALYDIVRKFIKEIKAELSTSKNRNEKPSKKIIEPSDLTFLNSEEKRLLEARDLFKQHIPDSDTQRSTSTTTLLRYHVLRTSEEELIREFESYFEEKK